ncbi:MAG: hypothetical protein ACFE96_18090 [Candidatus Hermodarchaeota archaeon]
MKILKIFNKFITNHSSSFYQVVVIAVPKEYDDKEFPDILKVSNAFRLLYHEDRFLRLLNNEDRIEAIEKEYKLELHSLTDSHNIYLIESRSETEDSFQYSDDPSYEELENYWDLWLQEKQELVDRLKQLEKQGIKILYLDEGCD